MFACVDCEHQGLWFFRVVLYPSTAHCMWQGEGECQNTKCSLLRQMVKGTEKSRTHTPAKSDTRPQSWLQEF